MRKLQPRLFLALAAVMTAQPAFGLSCMAPDLIHTLNEAKASETVYNIFVGRFDAPPAKAAPFANNRLPFGLQSQHQRPPEIVQSHFTGYALAQSSRDDSPVTRLPVNIEISCAASWCGHAPAPEADVIAFVEAGEDGHVLRASPCPGLVYPAAEPRIKTLRECLGKDCAPGKGLGMFAE